MRSPAGLAHGSRQGSQRGRREPGPAGRQPQRHADGGQGLGSAARSSAAWCRRAVDVCWASKRDRIRPEERGDAKAAYDEAAAIYDRILAECPTD